MAQRVEAKVAEFLGQHADLEDTPVGFAAWFVMDVAAKFRLMTVSVRPACAAVGCASLGYASMTLAMNVGGLRFHTDDPAAQRAGARAALRKDPRRLNELPESQQPKADGHYRNLDGRDRQGRRGRLRAFMPPTS